MSMLQSHLKNDDTPGLLINGFKVFSSLKHLLKSYKIQLSNCKSDQTQVEHDIIYIAPDGDRVRVNFTEAKASMEIPWPHEADKPRNIVSACETAFRQISQNVTAFGELAEYFLSREEFDKLSINFNVSITSLGEVSENDICQMCREFIFETKKDYTTLKMKEMFGISDLSPHTQSSLEIFKTLGIKYG